MTRTNKFEKLDKRFENFIQTAFESVSDSELTPAKKAERRKKAYASDLDFAKIYFPNIFNLPFNKMHKWVASLTMGKYFLSGFPESGKSAFVYIAKVIKPICMRTGGIVNVNADTLDVSEQRTAQLKRLIERNRKLCYDYDVEIEQDRIGYYIINNTHLVAGARRTGLRNLTDDDFNRIKYQVNDDLYDRQSVNSETENKRVVEFVEGEAHRQLQKTALSITTGNRITEDCPILVLQNKYPKQSFSFPALDEKGESNWKSYRTTAEWHKFFKTIPWDVVQGEYMDTPAVKGNIIQPEWLRTIHVNTIQFLSTIAALDPARGESPAACNKAFGVGSITSSRELVIRDLWERKEPYDHFFNYAWESLRKYHYKVLLIENDFAQWDFARDYYLKWQAKTSEARILPVVPFIAKDLQTQYHGADKESRFLFLVYPFQIGQVLFDEKLIGSNDYAAVKSDLLAIGSSKKSLDGADMLATLLIMGVRYIETGGFKSTKKRAFERVQGWFRK